MASGESALVLRRALLRGLDPLLLAGVMLLVGWLRWGGLPPSAGDWYAVIVAAALGAVVLDLAGAYRQLASPHLADWCGSVTLGLLLLSGLLTFLAFATQTGALFSRAVVLGWLLAAPVSLCLLRFLLHEWQIRPLTRGQGLEPALLVGRLRDCLAFARHLDRHPNLGLRAELVLSDDPPPEQSPQVALRPRTALLEVLATGRFGRVVLCCPPEDQHVILETLLALRDRPVPVVYAPDFSSMPIFSFRASDYAGRPVLDLSASPLSPQAMLFKEVEDRVLGLVALLVFAPVMLLVALALRLSGPGPILFSQERHGLGGRTFRVFKFRTMCAGIEPEPEEDLLPEALSGMDSAPTRRAVAPAEADAQSGTAAYQRQASSDRLLAQAQPFVQARSDDPRVTRLGAFLRRSSLDELPQLFNVLRGEMSLVGPRPHAVGHNQQFVDSIAELMRRHYVKPGMTGLAQINGARGETRTVDDMRRRIEYDLEYMRRWSPWLDAKILCMTVWRGFVNHQP